VNRLRAFWVRYRNNRAAVAGAIVLVLVVALSLGGPWAYSVDPFDMVGRPAELPFGTHALGTDVAGRDMLAGIIHGGRISLLIGVMASLAASVFGLALGALAGYYGGRIDDAIMRTTEFFLTIPSFVLAVVLVAIFTPTVTNITIAIAVVSWPSVARLARAEFIAHRDRDYVVGCRAIGMPDWEIIALQILPNALPPLIVVSSLMVATAILTESGLSFLGLGDPNQVSWGYMIGVARSVLRTAWWMAAIPGVMILITVLAINLVGEGLNDALNPRLRTR
jgi:peptide/nickel transport system permease protein